MHRLELYLHWRRLLNSACDMERVLHFWASLPPEVCSCLCFRAGFAHLRHNGAGITDTHQRGRAGHHPRAMPREVRARAGQGPGGGAVRGRRHPHAGLCDAARRRHARGQAGRVRARRLPVARTRMYLNLTMPSQPRSWPRVRMPPATCWPPSPSSACARCQMMRTSS